MERMYVVILVMIVVESAWALLCAVTDTNLFLYFAGLVVASVMFFIPGVAEGKRQTAQRGA